MESIMKRIMPLREDNKIEGGGKMLPIKKINTMEHKKMQELQNKIIGQGNNIGLTKGVVPDPRKRQFIRKWILGIIAGIGIAIFSKVAHAGGINFYGDSDAELMNNSKGVAKGWVSFTGVTPVINAQHNVDSVTDSGTGAFIVNWDTIFSGSHYAAVLGGRVGSNNNDNMNCSDLPTAGGTPIVTTTHDATPVDVERAFVVVFGEQ